MNKVTTTKSSMQIRMLMFDLNLCFEFKLNNFKMRNINTMADRNYSNWPRT